MTLQPWCTLRQRRAEGFGVKKTKGVETEFFVVAGVLLAWGCAAAGDDDDDGACILAPFLHMTMGAEVTGNWQKRGKICLMLLHLQSTA